MLVSVIIGLLNEEYYLPKLIEDLKNQDYNKKKIELIFIDGMSDDKSWDILENFKSSNNDFYDILLLKNEKRILSAGMNVGIKNASGDCFLKIDCHSSVPYNFISENVKTIACGEFVCGGPRPNIIEDADLFKRTLLKVEENIFGSGIASYRRKSKEKYVSSVFQGMYRRVVFEKCGLLDELVGRVEDNELHYRIRQKGYKIKYNSNIISYQFTRPTYLKMLRQKYSNGYWIGKTTLVHSNCFSIFHYIPFFFLVTLIFSLILLFLTNIPLCILIFSYGVVLFLITLLSFTKNFVLTDIFIPFLIFGIHISYGIGTLVGLLKSFSWTKLYNKNKKIEYLDSKNKIGSK